MARRQKSRDVHGILLFNKPLGISSNEALQRVKELYKARKAGHTGSLDPLATGLLPICFGEATKFSQLLLDSDKSYETTARLGEVRSTGDLDGEVVSTSPVPALSINGVDALLHRFIGPLEQVPPLFSALKFNGRPLHELAREGISEKEAATIAQGKRRVIRIHQIQLQELRHSEMDLSISCSKGTYIRTLVEDIGAEIGCGACVSRLHRTKTGPYDNKSMVTIEQLEALVEKKGKKALDDLLLPIETAIADWESIFLTWEEANALRHGQPVNTGLNDAASVQLWACDAEFRQLIGTGCIESGVIRSSRILNVSLERR